MSEQSYKSPKVISIVVGVILFALFLILMCSLSDMVKAVGYPFLLLPEKLGLIEVVDRDQVRTIHMAEGQVTAMEFTRPGDYLIYTNDYDLLLASAELSGRAARPWVTVRAPSGESETVSYIERGLRPYDTPFARGRPVLRIAVTETGLYQLRHPSKAADLFIVPDTLTGNEFTIVSFYLIQAGVLLLPALYLFDHYRRLAVARVKSVKQLKHIQGDDFWKRELTRRKEGDVKKPKDVYHNKWW